MVLLPVDRYRPRYERSGGKAGTPLLGQRLMPSQSLLSTNAFGATPGNPPDANHVKARTNRITRIVGVIPPGRAKTAFGQWRRKATLERKPARTGFIGGKRNCKNLIALFLSAIPPHLGVCSARQTAGTGDLRQPSSKLKRRYRATR